MIEPNMKLLEAMRTEANLCYERGDDEDGRRTEEDGRIPAVTERTQF